jgi:1-aminocyclopropane-1-carboxylate deaminase/D-cysteine desulfhydrase-like pyridoxal-dependent ACC family enzyme
MSLEASLSVAVTAVEYARNVSDALGCEVWVKRDDRTDPRYGGNKIRKLSRLFADARAREATDIVTIGALGSHHVLATAVHGRSLGFEVHAVVLPQPSNPHVVENARADLAQGAHLVVAHGAWAVPLRLASLFARLRAAGRRPYLISVGGSSPLGAVGYVDAMRELVSQHASGALRDWPEAIVCALGSGGTYAGLLAGARAFDVPSEVWGVRVTDPWMVSPTAVAWMSRRALALAEPEHGHDRTIRARDVRVRHDQLGRGYGVPTDAGREATEMFAADGIVLDPTYTAKAAAGLVAMAREPNAPRRFLFWHTLSSAPMEPLLVGAPDTLTAPLAALALS